MQTCMYLKQKLNKGLYCKKQKMLIKLSNCNCCAFKQYKSKTNINTLKKTTLKQNKKEKNRFSIIYPCLTKCAVCGLKMGVQKNEVFEGAKRGVSMQHGFVIPLCDTCHKRFHNDRSFALIYKKKFQAKYEETHSREEFLNLIHHNYL